MKAAVGLLGAPCVRIGSNKNVGLQLLQFLIRNYLTN